MTYAWYDFLGNVGVGLIVIAFLLLQLERMRSDDLAYSALNALGAVLILISLVYSFNLSAVVMEAIWVLISLIGIVKWWRNRT